MRFKTIAIGSWFPKTDLHLEEMEELFSRGILSGSLGRTEALKLLRKLDVSDVRLENAAGVDMLAATAGPATLRYHEDDLLTMEAAPAKDRNAEQTARALVQAYGRRVTPLLSVLFSR